MKKKILILPLFGLGDTILTTPIIEMIKTNSNNYEIHYLTMFSSCYEILKNNSYIDKLIFYPFLKKSKIKSLMFILKNLSFNYDIAINFFPSNRKDYNLLSLLTFASKRIGHRYLFCDLKELNFLKNCTVKEDENLHCVEENIKLLKFLNIKINNKDIPTLKIFLSNDEIEFANVMIKDYKNKIIIGIHPGTSNFKNHKYKRLPMEKWVEIINNLKDFYFFVFGTEEEEEELNFIYESSKFKNVKIIKNLNIRKVAAIIKELNLFITNDSGLMHVAAATQTPVIALFGPTNPKWVAPWKVKHKIIKKELECSPCFVYSPKPLTCKNKEKFICMKSIKGEDIIKEINNFINN